MKRIIIASTTEGAGKTSIIVGLMAAFDKTGKKFGYLKPFGDRLIYRRKRNWDYDSSLVVDLFGLNEEPENITIGFDHSRLRYTYNENSLETKLEKMINEVSRDKDLLLIEGGKDLFYGASLNLDPISLSRFTGGKLILVVSGDDDTIIDELTFLNSYMKNFISAGEIDFGGIILNKVRDVDEFENVHLEAIKDMGIDVLGIIPYKEQLSYYSTGYIAEQLMARVIAGEKGLNKIVKNIFVGAMSTSESLRNPLFNKENKFLITSGDRSDMILAALESDTVGVLLTNNILPPPNIITRATEKNIPLLLAAIDTFEAARKIDTLEALMTTDNTERLDLLTRLANKYISIKHSTR
ncbi:MAG: AAA family ATPase [bacterium]|nr:AAA family ATPase [bacterium]